MALDPIRNHAIGTVTTGYDIDDTSIVLASGHGAHFPDPATEGAYNLVWWNSTDYKNPSLDPLKEIIRVTGKSGDTLTVVRPVVGNSYNGEGSDNVAHAKNIVARQYKVVLTPTRKYMEDVQDALNSRMNAVTVGSADATYITDGTADDVQMQAAIDFVYAAGGGIVYLLAQSFQNLNQVVLKPGVRVIGAGKDKTIITLSASFADGVAFREQSGAANDLSMEDLTLNLSGKVDVGGIHVYQGNNSGLRRVRVTGQAYSSVSHWTVRFGNFAEGLADSTASFNCFLEELEIDNCNAGTYEQLLFVNQSAGRIIRPYFEANTNSLAYELMLYINNKDVVIESPYFRNPNAHSIGIMESDGVIISNTTAQHDDNYKLFTLINSRNVLVDGVQAHNSKSSPTATMIDMFDRALGPDGFSHLINDTERIRFNNIQVDGWKSTLTVQTIGTFAGSDYTANHSNIEFNNVTIKSQSVPWNIGLDDAANNLHDFDFNNVRVIAWSGASTGAWQLRGRIGTVGQMYGFRFRRCFVASSSGGGASAAIRNIAATVELVENCDFSATFTTYGALSVVSSGVFSKVTDVKGVNPNVAYQQGNITGATTITRVNGRVIFATLTGNVTATITNGNSAYSGDELILILTQDATGSRTISTPSNVVAINGASLVLSTAANAVDILKFVWNASTSKWVQTSQALGKASGAEVNAWTNDTKFITPKAFADSTYHSSLRYVSTIDCSGNPNYPAANNGHVYKVSVAGKIGGASGTVVQVGDMAICTVDSSASGDQATVGTNWFILQANLDIATGAEVDTGTDNAKFVTAKAMADSSYATEAYAQSLFAANDALLYKGAIDASGNPNYPAADAGHLYKISVAGKIGGASGVVVEVGDNVLCTVDGSSSGDQAAVGANWDIIQANVDKATGADVDTGTDDGKYVTSKAIRDSGVLSSAVSGEIASITGKTTPVDADVTLIEDSAATNAKKSLTWANIKATLKTYFDTLYQPLTAVLTATTASFTTTKDTKLSGIATGADVTVDAINAASTKAIPIDADQAAIIDSAASNVLKRVTFTNLKAFFKTYFDTLYPVYSSSAPSSPSDGQMWFNTTLKQMFYYDSTIDSGSWLSVEVFRVSPYSANVSTTNNPFWVSLQAMNSSNFDIYIEDMVGSTLIATTNDGSNYWSCFLSRRSSANADTAIANFTTAADTVATYTLHKQSVAVFIDVSAVDAKALLLTTTKTGSPGSITGSFGLNYRLVIPK